MGRLDGYIKPFFPVADLGVARDKAAAFGGRMHEGNVIQFRQDSTG